MKRIIGRLVAATITRAALSQQYAELPYMCLVLMATRPFNPLSWIAKWHINRVLGNNLTLHSHLYAVYEPIRWMNWENRGVYHHRFYSNMCAALRQGDWSYGYTVNLTSLGLVDHDINYDKPAVETA